jgi:hypothetical protein
MVSLQHLPTPDGSVAWSEYARYAIMLCEHGPFAPGQFLATINQASPAPQGASPGLGDFGGFPLKLGNRTGRVAVFAEVGHGVILVPLAAIPSANGRATLVIVMDDQHIGERGHEVKRALSSLGSLLDAVDKQSVMGRAY